MKLYTDYDFFSNAYKGKMLKSDFNKLVIDASCIIRNNIFDRDISEYQEEVQMATCSIIDILKKIEELESKKTNSISEKILKSESVADYTRTFETNDVKNYELEISNLKGRIKEEIRKYLLPTGLLYRGV